MTLTKAKPKRQPTNYRKIAGAHHKQDHHYMKHYWPYLPIFAALLLGVVGNLFINRSSHDVLGYATSISPTVLLADTNAARSTDKEDALQLDPKLAAAAQAKANDMAARNYWSHVTPDGKQPWSFIQASGYDYIAAGENLAYGFGTSNQVITAWMESPEHRANVLNGAYHDVGFATANIANYRGNGPETVVVALYGEPSNLNGAAIEPNSKVTTAGFSNISQPVSRLQMVTNATWVQLALAAVCGATLMLFFVRHTLAWHKVLVRGEQFALHHPFFDTFLISLAVLAFLLSHAAGMIL
jgi:hypothetical protein